VNVRAADVTRPSQAERQAAELLELFYQVHYRSNMVVEGAIRGELSPKQAAILWLIRSIGDDSQNAHVADPSAFYFARSFERPRSASAHRLRYVPPNGRSMRRKEIVLWLQYWFDVSNPAITKALRRMALPPMELVRLVEDADSAREKRVILTPKGEAFTRTMTERGRTLLQRSIEDIPKDQVSTGIEFLRAVVAAVDRVHSSATPDKLKSPLREQQTPDNETRSNMFGAKQMPAPLIRNSGRIFRSE